METTYTLPTCGLEFNLVAPYDADLVMAFNARIGALQAAVAPNTCNCQQSAADLGYTQALKACLACSVKVPSLEAYWGCNTCSAIVAPIWLHTKGQVGADSLSRYQTDASYRSSVDATWANASQCQRGAATKAACIKRPTFQIEAPNPPPVPTPATGMSAGAIAGIVIGAFAGVVILVGLARIPFMGRRQETREQRAARAWQAVAADDGLQHHMSRPI